MSGSKDFIPFSNNGDTPRGNNKNNWNNRSPFQNNKFNNFSPYNRRNNHNNSNKKFQGHQKFANSNGEVDISAYYHPSMMEDPWKHLNFNQKKSGQESTTATPESSSKQDDSSQNDSDISNKSSDAE